MVWPFAEQGVINPFPLFTQQRSSLHQIKLVRLKLFKGISWKWGTHKRVGISIVYRCLFFVSFSHPVQELIREVTKDYQIMEEFFYNLTDEDFSDKWAQGISPIVKVGHFAAITILSALGAMCLARAPAELLSVSQTIWALNSWNEVYREVWIHAAFWPGARQTGSY